jgi:hypothetical protein
MGAVLIYDVCAPRSPNDKADFGILGSPTWLPPDDALLI